MRRKFTKQMLAGVLGLSMIASCVPYTGQKAVSAAASKATATNTSGRVSKTETQVHDLTINGDDIKADNVNGLTYKGFGLLSGNSSSDLLMDYKSQNPKAYAQMLQYLFGGDYPIMTHVKLEMGNDRNNSTGAEASTKRTKTEEANILRDPGWQLAADAKKINPNIKVSILRWNAPEWVKSTEDVYTWYKESILKAYETYGYMVDYINPNVNERWGKESDIANTKSFANWIAAETKDTIPDDTERALFQKIKLVISDESGCVSDAVAANLQTDTDFYNSVDAVGYHYNPEDDSNGGMKWFAETADKEVWNSEAQATFSNTAFRPVVNSDDVGIGGTGSALEMGNTFIKGFVNSRRSHVIYQPAIGSFYEGGQYSFKELISARDPWSGWMHYDAGLLVLAHLSKFAKTGWENEDNTAGIWRGVPEASVSTAEGTNPVTGRNADENYMTLASPAKDNFSTIFVNDSTKTMTYNINVKNMKLSATQLGVWETRAADNGSFNENYMKFLGNVSADNNTYTVTVKPNSVVTVTSLDVSKDSEHTQTLPVEGTRTVLDTDSTGDTQNLSDDYLYADDFEYADKKVAILDGKGGLTDKTEDYVSSRGGETGAIARYTHNVNGAFETYKTDSGNHVLRQQLDIDTTGKGSAWNDEDAATLIGDFRWTNYTASVDALFEGETNEPYASLAIRQAGGYPNLAASAGYTLKVFSNGDWKFYRKNKIVTSGTLTADDGFKTGANVWNNLKLQANGATITALINDKTVYTYTDSKPIKSGRIGLGSAYTYTQFDNLKVTKNADQVPYYYEYLDDLETYDLTASKTQKLVYGGTWTHKAGQGMYVYQRTISSTSEVGATLSYTFAGTGIDLLAKVAKRATLKVIVDGTVVNAAAMTQLSDVLNTEYSLTGLPYAKHTVTFELVSGTLSVDAVGVLDDVVPKLGSYTPAPTPSSPSQTTAPATPSNTPSTNTNTMKKGTNVKVNNANYVVTNPSSKEVAFSKPTKKTITNVTIPATVKIKVNGKSTAFKVSKINSKAFANCKKLKSVTIGKNVKVIDKNAFSNCSKLKKIAIKSTSLKTVGTNAIKGIQKKAVITCNKKASKKIKKLFTNKTGFKKKTMKIK